MESPPIPLEPRNDPFQHAFNNTSKIVFKRLLHFSSLTSTNEYLKPLAKRGEIEGLVVLADEQTEGRGRLGRCWHSPAGGLYFSVLVRPMTIPALQTPLITLTTGLAVAKVIQTALGVNPALKWPNDIMIGNKKVAGILVDSAFIGQDIEYAIIGIGVNANIPLVELSEPLQRIATTLQIALNRSVNIPRLFGYLIGQLEFWYMKLRDKGFKAIEPHYRSLSMTLGKTITIDLGNQKVSGLAKSLDPDGGLYVQTADGPQVFRSGDVVSSKSKPDIE
ncbi:MAG: biotin--[acetyl-CoA-carboxylase] ligase [Promethearchaeota archaeon]